MKKRKVLIVSTVGLIYDGITNVILSCLKSMDKSDLEIYIAATIESNPAIRKQFESMNCKIVDFANRRTHTMKYFFELASFTRKQKIDVIHAHGNSGTLVVEMLASWLGGAKKRIAHSHNTKCNQKTADKLLRPIFNIFYTDAVACGIDAGVWLFKNRKFTVINNGRDIKLFAYNSDIRNKYRNQLGITDEIAVGHVGGFFEQKNHAFLLEIFREIKKIVPNVRLYLIGDGPLKEKIKQSANGMDVSFVGTVDNVSDYLNAMDCMLLPSLFEGLPLVALEWQINGLPVLISDVVTRECMISNSVEFVSLNTDARIWAQKILKLMMNNNRISSSQNAQRVAAEKGFDVRASAKILKKMYLDNK